MKVLLIKKFFKVIEENLHLLEIQENQFFRNLKFELKVNCLLKGIQPIINVYINLIA